MKFDINTAILIVNFFAYFFLFVGDYKRYKKITPYSFFALWFSLIALMAAVTYSNGVYFKAYLPNKTFIPLIQPLGLFLVFVFFYILIYPFKKLNSISIQKFHITKSFETVIFVYLLLDCILLFSYTQHALTLNAVDIYSNSREEAKFILPSFMGIATRLASLVNLFFLPYCFYQIRHKLSVKYIFYIIVMLLIIIQMGLLYSSRGTLFMQFSTVVFIFILFYKEYSKKTKRLFFILGAIALTIGIIYSAMITVSRYVFDNPMTSIQVYYGESFNHFCFRFWDSNDINTTYGEMYFPEIYNFLTGTPPKDFLTSQAKIDYMTNISNTSLINNFMPAYGMLTIEFGYFLPFIIVFIFSYFMNNFLKTRQLPFYRLPILIFWFQKLYFYSIFGFAAKDIDFFIDLFFIIVFSFLIRINSAKEITLKLS
jgi:oligosaccharide repeat unit polymerase